MLAPSVSTMEPPELIPDAWRDLVACPTCRAPLRPDARCAACGHAYAVRDGALDLSPRDGVWRSDADRDRWREALAGLDAWRRRRASPAAVTARPVVDPRITALVRDAALRGDVVDVGGASGAKRHAMPASVTRYLSVDPGASPPSPAPSVDGALAWWSLRGHGERLPVRDRAVDGVLSTAALDYFVDVPAGIAEFARVLRPGGVLALLVTAHPPAVARARDADARWRRVARSLSPSVRDEVGLAGMLSLVADAARAPLREHTRYLTEGDVLPSVHRWFEEVRVARDPGRYSVVLRVTGRVRG